MLNLKQYKFRIFKKYLFIIFSMLIFLSLAFFNLSEKNLNEEELSILDVSSRPISYNFIRTGVPHPPLWFFILHFWNISFGIGSVSSRILPIIFGLLSIFMIHKLAKFMFNQKVANLSAFFLAICPILIDYSRIVDKYSLFIFLSIINFYTFIRFLKDGTKKNWIFLLASSFFLAQTHFYSMFLFFVEFLYLLFNPHCRCKIKKVSFIFLIVGCTFIPQLLLTIKYGLFDFPYNEPWHDMLFPPNTNTIFNLFYHIVIGGIKWFGVLMLALFYFIYIRTKDKNLLSNLLFIFLPILFFILSFFINIRHYQIIFLLPFYLLYFSKYLHTISVNIKHVIILIIIILSTIGISDVYAKKHDISYINYIESNFKEGDVLYVDGFKAFEIEYHSNLKYKNFTFYDFSDPGKISNSAEGRNWFIYNGEIKNNDLYYFNNSTITWLRNNCNETEIKDIYICD